MRLSPTFAVAGLLIATPAFAVMENNTEALVNSGPVTTTIPIPDPTHILMRFGKDIKFTATQNEIPVFGDPEKAGPYGILIRWDPGNNSKPHFHSNDRYIYVVSGTWWVSSSTTYDKDKMYPIPAGTFVTDLANTIHWDGAKAGAGPCILLLVGEGPIKTTRYVPKDAAKAPEGQLFVEDKK